MQHINYRQNALVHKDRRPPADASDWVNSFTCFHLKPLIVCRGPIRKEAMEIFDEMGITNYGILLSEKDSIVYTFALAPELRKLTDPSRIHHVPDYSGANRAEREQRLAQIIEIALDNGYNSIFAGYGFMAEDETFVTAIEKAGLLFIGPNSRTVREAGRKDEAKRTALGVAVSVTPGVDNVTTLCLLGKYPDRAELTLLAKDLELVIDEETSSLEDLAGALLEASYQKGIDLISIDEIAATVRDQLAETWRAFPDNRIRLKAIGGGGGKGQRILDAPTTMRGSSLEERIELATAEAPAAVREVLGEVKAMGVGDNKNMLLELNVEYTRHQEIQLIGNGQWCLSLGARDCSLQMHEQKLLEASVTHEELELAIKLAQDAGDDVLCKALSDDLAILDRMENESTRFGSAVGLDSVSTFECIVDRKRHFFMEMNTRIQVEHRVTELCYALRFSNPEDSSDSFVVDSLVEVMVLLAAHKSRLPQPQRFVRFQAAVEARLNATDASLAPHAGAIITHWSDPLLGEIRDDQGICLKNPDTDSFMKYRLAGAYDSNIALLVAQGENRKAAYTSLCEILRRSKLQGQDLATNMEFHYGLLHWFLSRSVRAKSTTRFVMPYLTMVGLLKGACDDLDLDWSFDELLCRRRKLFATEALAACDLAMSRKRTLILRPLMSLARRPHVLSGWLSYHRQEFKMVDGKIDWLVNPICVLADTYHYLNMDWRENAMAAEIIWEHDQDLLTRALHFYEQLGQRLDTDSYVDQQQLLLQEAAPQGWSSDLWLKAREAHLGFQLGMELLDLLPLIAHEVDFFDLSLNSDLTIHIPEKLHEPALQERMRQVLAPAPEAGADEIVAISGGMYYAREAPDMPPFLQEGDHFERGQPLYIVEVMKMFNKVYAPFAGTLDKILVQGDGMIVSKGQPLFKVSPDERFQEVDPVAESARIHKIGARRLDCILPQ